MVIGNMIFGLAIEGANLHIRIALKTLLLLGPKPERFFNLLFVTGEMELMKLAFFVDYRMLLAFIVVSFIFSMWIANIGVVVMLLPIIFAIQKELLALQSSSRAVVTVDDGQSNVPDEVSTKAGLLVTTYSVPCFFVGSIDLTDWLIDWLIDWLNVEYCRVFFLISRQWIK